MASQVEDVNVECINRESKHLNSITTMPEYHLIESSSGVQLFTNKLIVTYIPAHMEEADILTMFQAIGQVVEFKVIKKKHIPENAGFGFVTYIRDEDAEEAIKRIHGIRVYNKTLKVCFARPNSSDIRDTNLIVSGFSKSMTEEQLEKVFKPFGSIISSHILYDNITNRQFVEDGKNLLGISKGVGFIRYNTSQEAETAIQFLNGVYLEGSRKPLVVKYASNFSSTFGSWNSRKSEALHQTQRDYHYIHRNSNTNVVTGRYSLFIYNLPGDMTEKYLWDIFVKFGEINRVKIVRNLETKESLKYGFVNFIHYENAVAAIRQLNGKQLKGHVLQVRFQKNH